MILCDLMPIQYIKIIKFFFYAKSVSLHAIRSYKIEDMTKTLAEDSIKENINNHFTQKLFFSFFKDHLQVY